MGPPAYLARFIEAHKWQIASSSNHHRRKSSNSSRSSKKKPVLHGNPAQRKAAGVVAIAVRALVVAEIAALVQVEIVARVPAATEAETAVTEATAGIAVETVTAAKVRPKWTSRS